MLCTKRLCRQQLVLAFLYQFSASFHAHNVLCVGGVQLSCSFFLLVLSLVHSLPCSEETQTILAGYIVQGEFGDYDAADHTPGYLDDYPFVMGKVSCNLGWAEA